MSNRCQCKTAKGIQCSRNAKPPGRYCYQHVDCKNPMEETGPVKPKLLPKPRPKPQPKVSPPKQVSPPQVIPPKQVTPPKPASPKRVSPPKPASPKQAKKVSPPKPAASKAGEPAQKEFTQKGQLRHGADESAPASCGPTRCGH
jgi:hypothetical protein